MRHLVSVDEVKPRCGYQSLCAVCGSNLAELNPSVYSLVPPCMADVTVDCALCRQSNKRTLLLLLLLLYTLGTSLQFYCCKNWFCGVQIFITATSNAVSIAHYVGFKCRVSSQYRLDGKGTLTLSSGKLKLNPIDRCQILVSAA